MREALPERFALAEVRRKGENIFFVPFGYASGEFPEDIDQGRSPGGPSETSHKAPQWIVLLQVETRVVPVVQNFVTLYPDERATGNADFSCRTVR